MKKVTVLMNNGSIKTIDYRFARALVHCKKAVFVEDYEKKVIKQDSYVVKDVQEKKDELTLEQLRELAKESGVKVHHKAGVEKIKEALGL